MSAGKLEQRKNRVKIEIEERQMSEEEVASTSVGGMRMYGEGSLV